MTIGVTGGYVRHRNRMIQESVFEDLVDTLIACRWMAGTTSREVWNPYNPGVFEHVTTTADQILPLLEGNPVVPIDFFPEAEEGGAAGESEGSRTEPNTLAIDSGEPGEPLPLELGSNAVVVPYTVSMAFFAVSDAVALALLNDLADRYRGALVRQDFINLWNYNATDPEADPVARLDVETFHYRVNTEQVAPHEVHLYFAELDFTDEVDAANPGLVG